MKRLKQGVKEREKKEETKRRTERKQEIEEKEMRLRIEGEGQLRRLILDEYGIVESGVVGRKEATITQFATANIGAVTRADSKSPLLVFLKVLPKAVWDHIRQQTNMNMGRKARRGDINGYYAKCFCSTDVTVLELLQLIGIRLGRVESEKVVLIKRMHAIISSL